MAALNSKIVCIFISLKLLLISLSCVLLSPPKFLDFVLLTSPNRPFLILDYEYFKFIVAISWPLSSLIPCKITTLKPTFPPINYVHFYHFVKSSFIPKLHVFYLLTFCLSLWKLHMRRVTFYLLI